MQSKFLYKCLSHRHCRPIRLTSWVLGRSWLDVNVINNHWFFISRPYLVWSRLCYSVASVVVCLSSVCMECIVAKRCVLEQKLLLTAYNEVVYEKGPPIGNDIWGIICHMYQCINTSLIHHMYQWSRDRWRHVTPKVLWGSTVGYHSDSLASCWVCFTILSHSCSW